MKISMRQALMGATLLAGCGAAPQALAGQVLYLTSSQYAGSPSTVRVGQALPDTNGATAIADGTYPTVFNNDTVDPNFGVTAPIVLRAFPAIPQADGSVAIGNYSKQIDITRVSGVSTSFSSKSELSVLPSVRGTALTLMGYATAVNQLDISNSNTPGVTDPTNTDTAPATYRSVVEIDLDGSAMPMGGLVTKTNAYSGDNGRGAILASGVAGTTTNEYMMVGNAGNGSGTPPDAVVADTGVQTIVPGSLDPTSFVIGNEQGTAGSKNGHEFGYSVVQNGYDADKSGKDDNFRGAAVSDQTLYVTKGSGGNGVNSVYQVMPAAGGLPTPAGSATTSISILPGFPTGLAANIVQGDPATEFYPFGIFFASPTVLYVADEGPKDLSTDPNAGLQKWVLSNGVWSLAYVMQAGLNLDVPYTVRNYPSQYYPATTGLRHLTGVVNGDVVTLFATTATFSNLGDPGADPNQAMRVVDSLSATSQPAGAVFSVVGAAQARGVYRGVAMVSSTN